MDFNEEIASGRLFWAWELRDWERGLGDSVGREPNWNILYLGLNSSIRIWVGFIFLRILLRNFF